MNKLAAVVLQFNKTKDFFWSAMLNVIDTKTVQDYGDEVVALLPVKSYSLEDHQFIQIKIEINNGAEALVWVPRGIVRTIVEGKTDLRGAFSFAGSKLK
jgi:hypothetical protein